MPAGRSILCKCVHAVCICMPRAWVHRMLDAAWVTRRWHAARPSLRQRRSRAGHVTDASEAVPCGGMPELTAQQRKEREADNAKERSTRRAVQTYTSAESHADSEALHLNRALLRARCAGAPATVAASVRCDEPPVSAARRLQRMR